MSDDIAGEVERYQFWVEDLIRQRNDALGRVDDLAGDHAIRDAETRYPEVQDRQEPEVRYLGGHKDHEPPEPTAQAEKLPWPVDAPQVEKMRWSLGLRDGQVSMGPEEPGWMYLLPDGSRTNSCDEARAGWLLHCEAVGERMGSVVRGVRDIIVEVLESDGSEDDPGPHVVDLITAMDTMDAIISTTVAQTQPTPPEMLPVRQRPRPEPEEPDAAEPEESPGSDHPPDDTDANPEAVGERLGGVLSGLRDLLASVRGPVSEGSRGGPDIQPYETELKGMVDTMDAIISTTVAQTQPTPPEMLPVRPRSVMAVLEDEIDANTDDTDEPNEPV